MSRHCQSRTKTPTRTIVAAAFAVAGLAITGAGVYAGLGADATGTQAVNSGTLSLTITPGTTAAFSAAVANLAPGDVVNRFVDLSNGGDLDAKTLTLRVAGSTNNLLTSSSANGLQVAVSTCATAWTVVAGLPSCSGGATAALSGPVSTLAGTPGTVQATVAAGALLHLNVSLSLPDKTETTTNGTLPGGTIQGLTNTLTYTFNEVQRTAVTTNS
jgi:spore coat-associated protein N